MTDWKAVPVDESGVSTRIKNSLRSGGYYSLGDVALADDHELMRCGNLGQSSVKEIRAYIQREYGSIGGRYRLQLERQLAAMKERQAVLTRDIATLEKKLAE